MKISYAITVCDEKKEIKRLVDFLLHHKRQNDEVVVLFDQKNGDEEIATMLTKLNKLPNFQIHLYNLKLPCNLFQKTFALFSYPF